MYVCVCGSISVLVFVLFALASAMSLAKFRFVGAFVFRSV